MNWAAVTFALQDFCGIPVAGQRGRSMTIIIQLHLAKWWWVIAVEVLPGEKERSCLLFSGLPHSVEGGEIICFLVDMHNLRAYLAHNLAQAGIEVQVKVTVEQHRGDDHPVALDIETLQHLLAPVVTPPVCWSNQG